jgi:hypothetical protein
MTGETLAVALRRTIKTGKKVVVIDNKRIAAKLSAEQALELITGRSHWHGSGTKHRISSIEFRPPVYMPKRFPWQECWLTTEAAVLQPSITWLHSRRIGYAEAA